MPNHAHGSRSHAYRTRGWSKREAKNTKSKKNQKLCNKRCLSESEQC